MTEINVISEGLDQPYFSARTNRLDKLQMKCYHFDFTFQIPTPQDVCLLVQKLDAHLRKHNSPSLLLLLIYYEKRYLYFYVDVTLEISFKLTGPIGMLLFAKTCFNKCEDYSGIINLFLSSNCITINRLDDRYF